MSDQNTGVGGKAALTMAALRQPLRAVQCRLSAPQEELSCRLRLKARGSLRGQNRQLCRSSVASSIVAEANLSQSRKAPSPVPIPVPSSPRLSNSKLPEELATLQELVSQLSRKADEGEGDGGVSQLRQAVGELAEDLKRQISAVAVSAKPTQPAGLGLANSPGRNRLTPATDGEAFRAAQGLVDLEGLIPQPTTGRAAGDAPAEPSVARSEVSGCTQTRHPALRPATRQAFGAGERSARMRTIELEWLEG